jgi:hypothetical protein
VLGSGEHTDSGAGAGRHNRTGGFTRSGGQ